MMFHVARQHKTDYGLSNRISTKVIMDGLSNHISTNVLSNRIIAQPTKDTLFKRTSC